MMQIRALRSANGLASQMVRGAAGPIASALPLFALPIMGAAFLPNSEFAMWSILASISTLALSIDFGGPAYLASRLDPKNRGRPFVTAAAMSCMGTLIVGVLCVGAWVPFSRTSTGSSFDFGEGVQAIAAISAGSALRSVVQLQSQVALFDKRFVLRNSILLVHAVTAFVTALVVLVVHPSTWALPIAWFIAGAAGLVVGVAAFGKPSGTQVETWSVETSRVASSATYVWARTLANLFRGLLMQADRWIVGAVGGPGVLAAYEVAWRVAVLPRFLAENLTFIVGIDAARVRASFPGEISERIKYSLRLTLVVVLTFSVAVSGLYALLPTFTGIDPVWIVFVLLLAAHGAVASGAPISFVGNGLGIPTIDLPYLTAAVCCSAIFAVGAYYSHHVFVFIGGMVFSLIAGNLWLIRSGMKVLDFSLSSVGSRTV